MPSLVVEGMEALSPREQEVLDLLATGLRPDAIGRHLDITTATTRGHLKSIRRKLDVQSSLQAVVVGARMGLVSPG